MEEAASLQKRIPAHLITLHSEAWWRKNYDMGLLWFLRAWTTWHQWQESEFPLPKYDPRKCKSGSPTVEAQQKLGATAGIWVSARRENPSSEVAQILILRQPGVVVALGVELLSVNLKNCWLNSCPKCQTVPCVNPCVIVSKIKKTILKLSKTKISMDISDSGKAKRVLCKCGCLYTNQALYYDYTLTWYCKRAVTISTQGLDKEPNGHLRYFALFFEHFLKKFWAAGEGRLL